MGPSFGFFLEFDVEIVVTSADMSKYVPHASYYIAK